MAFTSARQLVVIVGQHKVLPDGIQ